MNPVIPRSSFLHVIPLESQPSRLLSSLSRGGGDGMGSWGWGGGGRRIRRVQRVRKNRVNHIDGIFFRNFSRERNKSHHVPLLLLLFLYRNVNTLPSSRKIRFQPFTFAFTFKKIIDQEHEENVILYVYLSM